MNIILKRVFGVWILHEWDGQRYVYAACGREREDAISRYAALCGVEM